MVFVLQEVLIVGEEAILLDLNEVVVSESAVKQLTESASGLEGPLRCLFFRVGQNLKLVSISTDKQHDALNFHRLHDQHNILLGEIVQAGVLVGQSVELFLQNLNLILNFFGISLQLLALVLQPAHLHLQF